MKVNLNKRINITYFQVHVISKKIDNCTYVEMFLLTLMMNCYDFYFGYDNS